jgi:4-hydroxyphenylpyruvate dioxygenase
LPEVNVMPDPRATPKLRTCIATVSLSGTLPEKLEAAAAAGFDGVEIFEADLLAFGGPPAEVRSICEGLGLAIDIYQPFRDFEAMPEPVRSRNLDRAERKFDVMQALGTGLLLVCSNVQAAALDDDARAAADLAEMAQRAARRGLRVGYEALAWGRHVRRWGHAWRIVQQAAHPALGLIVDSFHTLSLNDDPAGIASVPADKLFFVQLADAPRLAMDVLNWSRHFRNFPGQGDLDVAGFVRAVLASGYSGPLSLEIFNDEFRGAPSRMMARDGLRSLALVQAEAQGPDALPAAPVLDGVEFLEFAVDEAAKQELAGLLMRLGFRHGGHHRSKAVDLYCQGRTNIVLNSEPDSAAAEHFQLHGPSVCAMALRVDDVGRTLARAQILMAPEWHERIGAGERPIPALRAPDGTLIYLVQPEAGGPRFWDDDFHLIPGEDGAVGLDGIDHIVQALPPGRIDNFVLFWRGVFGLVPQSQQETADPYGLVRSRALVSPGGKFRLALNTSESRGTATSRFVSGFAGAGVHHVAFATADIETAAAALEALGAPTLPMPENYYDDLSARWGLDDAALAGLQLRNLLYDRDENGAFWHLYTDAFHDRFFFEVVQREPGYAGFGAANAPVRTAVQARRHAADPLF